MNEQSWGMISVSSYAGDGLINERDGLKKKKHT